MPISFLMHMDKYILYMYILIRILYMYLFIYVHTCMYILYIYIYIYISMFLVLKLVRILPYLSCNLIFLLRRHWQYDSPLHREVFNACRLNGDRKKIFPLNSYFYLKIEINIK